MAKRNGYCALAFTVAAVKNGPGRFSLARAVGRPKACRTLAQWAVAGRDALLEAPPPPSGPVYPHEQAALCKLHRTQWIVGTPLDWALETGWIMRTPATAYLGNPGGLELGDVFVAQNYPIAAEQVEKAGVRLAALLEGILR